MTDFFLSATAGMLFFMTLVLILYAIKGVFFTKEAFPIFSKYMWELKYGEKEIKHNDAHIYTKNYVYCGYFSDDGGEWNSGSICVYKRVGFNNCSSYSIYDAGWGSSSDPMGFKQARKIFIKEYEKHKKGGDNAI